MNRKNFMVLTGLAAVAVGASIAITTHRDKQQTDLGGTTLFADLKPSLSEVEEIRFSKGDGSRTTLHKGVTGWTVVERQYPADASRVRDFALALANLKVVERKTSDPANYAKLGVEPPDTPTATSTLVEVVAGKKTWTLIVGKGADGNAAYVRKPAEAGSVLAQPLIAADPDPKRWIDRLVTDIPGSNVHDIAVKTATGPAYLLTRADRSVTDFTLSPIPKGRAAVSPMSLNGQADALTALNFDDVRTVPETAATPVDVATYRTFDGQVIEFTGHREGEKAFVRIAARRDAGLAAKFPDAAPSPAPAVTPGAPDKVAPDKAAPDKAAPVVPVAAAAKPTDQTAERLELRAKGVEYEIPAYKYEAIFKKPEDLLEKPAK